ncbi:MAG: polymerase [Treponema sp.]|jgi:hypothetical protein|nr:polymerase [Treponema sp.]
MKRILSILAVIICIVNLYAQEKIDIAGIIDWETHEISSAVSLDLASAGVRLPAGRAQAESIIAEGYTRLIRQGILEFQVDSSSTIANLLERNELSLAELDIIFSMSTSLPPSLTPNMLNMTASFSIPIILVNNILQKHSQPSPASRTINPVSAAQYTGIVIIASESLPAHGMRSSSLPVPCLFPKIWDTEMNLIYDRNMTTPGVPMIRYSSPKNILFNTPSGLSPELQKIAGERPLRIFARGVFGLKPTDLIIDRADALVILSSEANRSLLTQGKVVIILNDSVLKTEFNF